MISKDLVLHEASKSPGINQWLAAAVAEVSEAHGSQPEFKAPNIAYRDILRGADEAIRKGDWRNGMLMAEYGTRVDAYTVDGARYYDAAQKVFDYTTTNLAYDAVPSLATDDIDRSSREDQARHVATTTREFLRAALHKKALAGAREEFQRSPTACEHLDSFSQEIEMTLNACEDSLRWQQSQSGVSYFTQFKNYLASIQENTNR